MSVLKRRYTDNLVDLSSVSEEEEARAVSKWRADTELWLIRKQAALAAGPKKVDEADLTVDWLRGRRAAFGIPDKKEVDEAALTALWLSGKRDVFYRTLQPVEQIEPPAGRTMGSFVGRMGRHLLSMLTR